ncbi:MAG: phage tail tube protein [Candidatus Syntrophopropionicum ammoniitolerans]
MGEITGIKTKFYREGATQGTFEEIAQVASITPPQPEREVVEVDELDPPGGVRKKLVGLIDAGEVSLTLNFDPTNTGHLDLEQDFRDGVAKQYRIKLPNGYGWTFSALCTAYQPQEISAGDVVQAEVTLAPTGVYTFGEITDGV